ncbi:MAG: chitobiase/beta-hexosaminidase C-terminal domain-containing protein, partial [Candidatus ainarchaeum sp.]|nr:chitobiase/beta-hexosaminidase C-terminal domain-containing protein [Candidatus ainarchaeum sp.]
AIIRYTTDMSTPDESSPIYTNEIPISEGLSIQAIAYKTGMEPSSKVKFNYSIDYGGTLEFTDIKIDDGAIPTGVVANAPFTLKVIAEATVPSVRVSRVIIQKNGMDTDACKFLGVGAVGKDITCIAGICTDLGYLTNPEIAGTSYFNNFKFSCSEPGTYSFVFKGVLKTDSAEYSHMTSSQPIVIAPPTPNTIVAEIISPQDGLYYKDKPLILSSNIIGAEKEDLFCNWYATSKESQASLFLSDKCDSLYDLSSGDLELDKSYEINLFVSEKEGELSAAASPKIITIVNVDSTSSYLKFDPASGQEANKYFITTYYSREIAEFENGAYFNVSVPGDNSCNFELSRAVPEMLVIIDSDDVSQVFYKYKFKSICSTSGVKNILLELYNSDGFGTRQIIEADTISANYEIFDEEVTVFTDFYFYFPQGPNIPSIEEFFDDEIQVKGKDLYKDVLYFLPPADQTVPNPDIEIPQGKGFSIYSYVDSDPSYYMAGQETCSIQFVPTNGNTQTKIQTFNQPCNSYRFYQPTLEGYYSAKFSVITPRGETVVKSKIVRFVPNPIAFAPMQDFGNLYYTGIDFPLNIRLINPTFTPVTMTYGLYVSSIDDPTSGYINNDGTNLNFAAPEVFDPMDGYKEIVSGGSFTCSAPYLNCNTTIPGTHHDQHGVYKIKITASDPYGHSIDTWYGFRTSVPPEGAEIRTSTGKSPTELKLTGVLYRHETIGGISRKIYNIGERCQWTINGVSINATACDLYYEFGTSGNKIINVIVYENYSGLSPVSKTAIKNVFIEYVPNAYNITVDTDYIEMGDDVQFKANYLYPAYSGINEEVLAEYCGDWKVDGVIMPGTEDCTYNHYFSSPGEYELVAIVYFNGAATEVSKTVYVYGT